VADTDGRRLQGRKSGGLSEKVRSHLYDQIIAGAFKPGDIIQINAIAQELGVSRTPVREALLSLQQSRIVSVVPNQGFLVRGLTLTDVRDIYLMRRILECASSERAAAVGSAAALAALGDAHERSRQLAQTHRYDAEFDRSCHEFHREIAVAASSDRLLTAVDVVFGDQIRLQSIGVNPPDPTEVVDEHEAIYRAIIEKDPKRARDAMDRHIDTLFRIAVAKLRD
jgi:DNA-binding GntR family transcriptional regulator